MAFKEKIRRIALLGMHLESNSFAPVCSKDSFYSLCYLEGDEIIDDIKSDNPKQPVEISSFFNEMNTIGIPWKAVPILVTASEPNGPCNQEFFNNTCDRMRELLYAADPLDGVYFSAHGGMTATESLDPDGDLFKMVREVVGPDVPIIATLDLHANISEEMISVDIFRSWVGDHSARPQGANRFLTFLVRPWGGGAHTASLSQGTSKSASSRKRPYLSQNPS